MNKEIEIKLQINNEELKRLEKELNLENEEWIFERTYGFFTPDGESIKKGIFPRIKSNGTDSGNLCVKVKESENKDYFERKEYEMFIGDVGKMTTILKVLGYTDIRVFEKFRKSTIANATKICLDKLPFGYFIEIEGEKEYIEKMVKRLNLKNNERITKAYLKIAEEMGWKGDVIFEGR
jgi:adenylate cyclase class 2